MGLKSPLNYLGGKSRLAERIVELIPEDHTCYCEPFCGAAWVFFNRDTPSQVEVINDADGDLVNFWRICQNHLEEFLRYYRFAVVSRKIFEIEGMKRVETLTDVQRAVRYYYLQKACFGGKTSGRTFGTSALSPSGLNLTTIEERLLEVHWRLSRVTIENLDACSCIHRYDRPTTFFYLDPPYWKTAGYAVKFGPEEYHRLNKVLLSIKGRFLMSLNDAPDIRKIYRSFRIRKVTTTYSSANGRSSRSGRSIQRDEVIIDNMG
jgi:DNA adenine methylase